MKKLIVALFVLLVVALAVTPALAGNPHHGRVFHKWYGETCVERTFHSNGHHRGWEKGPCPDPEPEPEPDPLTPKTWAKEGDSHPWVPGPFETQMSIASNPAWVGNTIQVMFEDGTEILECRGVVEPLGDISCVFEPEVAGPVTLYTYMNGSLVSTNVVDGHTAYYGTFDATNMVLRMGALPYPG